MTLAKKAGTAGALMLLRRGWGAIVSFGVMAYLARTLSKEDFGIVAISAVLITLIQVFATSGLSEYVIFFKGENEKRVINSAFWLNLVLSIIVAVIILILAPFWAEYYKDDRISNIVYLLVFGFLINMQAAIPSSIFRKQLNYKPMIAIQTIFGTVSNLSQVGFAYFGFGVYSLALPNLLIAPFMTVALFYKSGFRPTINLGFKDWRSIFNYTKNVIGQRVFGKFVNDGDTFIVGKFFGMSHLGVYNLAFQFSGLFVGYLLPIITDISMPALAKNRESFDTVQRHLLKMVSLIAFICFPVIGAMIFGAEFLITFIYGDNWLEAVLPFQLLSIFVLVRVIGSPVSGLFNVMGKPEQGFYFTVIFSIVFLISIGLAGYFLGFLGFIIVLVLIRFFGNLVNINIALKLVQMPLTVFYRSLKTHLSILFVATAFSLLFRYFISNSSLLSMIVFLSFYFIGIYWNRKNLSSIWSDIRKMIPEFYLLKNLKSV